MIIEDNIDALLERAAKAPAGHAEVALNTEELATLIRERMVIRRHDHYALTVRAITRRAEVDASTPMLGTPSHTTGTAIVGAPATRHPSVNVTRAKP